MKKIDLGQTISTLANIGVIAGIVFLGVESSQSTKAVMGATYQTLSSERAERAELLADSSVMTTAVQKMVLEGLDALSPQARNRVNNAAASQYYRLDGWFYQYELGLLGSDFYETVFAAQMRGWVPRWRDLGILEDLQRERAIRPTFEAEIGKYVNLPVEW